MNKKIKIISENSNALLIFITIISLILIINTSVKSNRRSNVLLIEAVNLYMNMDDEKNFRMEHFHQAIENFSGSYSGPEGKKTEELLEELDTELTFSELKNKLSEFITQYQIMLEDRIDIFNTLFFFLTAGIIIQFIFMLASARKHEITSSLLEDSEEVLALLNREREKERLRISSYLHDSILQEIGSLLLSNEMQSCETTARAMQDISENLRNLTYSISPLHLSTTGLSDTLSEHVKEFEAETGINAVCIINSFNDRQINKDAQLVIFRIVQEALNNVKKHALAGNVTVKIVTSHPYLIIRIKDDGIGMKHLKFINQSNRSAHLGMRLMYEQAKSIGASISGTSAEGEGTEITLKYPLQKGK